MHLPLSLPLLSDIQSDPSSIQINIERNREMEEPEKPVKLHFLDQRFKNLHLSLFNQIQEETEKWIKYYSSFHQILLVGEGDFSFSLCLGQSFGSASNIVATSLDQYDSVIVKYSKAKSNLESLEKLGASIMLGVDATRMKLHSDLLQMGRFDRIIYNFPHAGFHGKEEDVHQINKHKSLVEGFFKNASGMLRPYGEVHINHKRKYPYNHWNLEELASRHNLILIECVDFNIEDYPGYNNKKGSGPKCDEPFMLGKSSTFKFVFSNNIKKKTQQTKNFDYSQNMLPQVQQIIPPAPRMILPYTFSRIPQLQLQMIPPQIQYSAPLDISSARRDLFSMHDKTGNLGSQFTPKVSDECNRIFDGYFKHAVEMSGRSGYDVREVVEDTLRTGFDRYMTGGPGRTILGYVTHLEELHSLSIFRSSRLRRMLLEHDKQKNY